MMVGIEELVPRFQRAKRFALTTLVKPDGDALGSLFGLTGHQQARNHVGCDGMTSDEVCVRLLPVLIQQLDS